MQTNSFSFVSEQERLLQKKADRLRRKHFLSVYQLQQRYARLHDFIVRAEQRAVAGGSRR